MAYITINNYTKKIQGNIVLDNINLSLDENKIYGFVGKNGCGKTMLFRAICGLIRPTQGYVSVNDKRIGKDVSSPDNLGIIIENCGLWNEYTGVQNLKMLTKLGKKVSIQNIKQAIERVGLNPKDKKTIGQYSLGMKQRIVFAQAIMEQPTLLVLDEPTNALDESGVELIRNIILEEKEKGTTILIASHNKEDIENLCDTVFHMEQGVIIV